MVGAEVTRIKVESGLADVVLSCATRREIVFADQGDEIAS